MDKCTIFIIPNSKKEGSQNFFRKLFDAIEVKNKILMIEEGQAWTKRIATIYQFSRAKKLTLVTTVNSNKLGLIYKCIFPKTNLISRLGNTISQEIQKNSFKYFIHKFFYFFLIKLSNHFIFQSKYMKQDFIQFFNFKDQNNFSVIYNGTSIVNPSIFSAKDQTPKPLINFLLVSSFKPQKGYDVFFDAIQIIETKIHDSCHFNICGQGSGLEEFKSKIKASNLQDIFSIHGNVEPESFYANSDIYILPSKFEGFSNSLIEALSYGLPSIVADCPGANGEVVIESFNGIFFKNLDSEDLSKKIIFMLKNLKKYSPTAIRDDVNFRFSIEKISLQYREII
ncbi:glycosyltransferase [Gammaproteobacteria bacterium]|nr:glycosyltransferase [Gammaproteobacteria bacterium]